MLHLALYRAPLLVQGVEFAGDSETARGIVAQQAFDAEGHVGHASGGVQARAERAARGPSAGTACWATDAPTERLALIPTSTLLPL